MTNDERLLKVVYNEIKDQICDMEILTPELFTALFFKNAAAHNIKLDEEVAKQYIDNQILNFKSIQNETSQSADKLSMSTIKAINAIQEKDETTLKDVLEETQTLKSQIEELKSAVYKDELTNVYNRKWLYDNYLTHEHNFTLNGLLAIIDLNYFKQINDTYGHIVGDKVLVFIASQLKKLNAQVVRYGGDEFILMFNKEVSKINALKQLHNLRENILKKHLTSRNSSFKVSFSFGVSEYKKDASVSQIIEHADENMYSDKIKIKEIITGIDI